MKTNKLLMLTLSIVALFTITSCVEDDDYTVPTSIGNEENEKLQDLLATGTELTISEVKALYSEGTPYEVESNLYVKGYVSSSDQTGNFYKEFFIQDSPTDPTNALKVIIDQVDSYNQFNLGREVYINLQGLFIGEERVGNGIITIGGDTETDQYGTTVLRINEVLAKEKILRSAVTETLSPLTVAFSQINNNHVGILVKVENVEFADDELGLNYFDPTQAFDTQRTLQTCVGLNYNTFILETSSFASFKDYSLPEGNGDLVAVVNKTYDGSTLVLALNSTDDVAITDDVNDRCVLLDPNDFVTIFNEDFQTVTNNTDLDLTGWTNFAEEGGWVWREKTYDGNGYAEFSTYNSGDDVNIAWMITPGIDMDAQDNEFLNFKSAQHHLDSPENTLEIFVSTDYDGSNVLDATWEPISATIATQSNSWYDFVDSGLIDLSEYTGMLYVAFKVTGSGTDTQLDGAYQIDDVSIIATN